MTKTPDDRTETSLGDQIKAHPGLVLAGGLALGVLASALLPRGSARKLAKGALAAASVGSEAGMAMARQAREKARQAADGAGEGAGQLRRRATAASGSAASVGIDLARAGLRMLASLRR